MHSKRKHIRRPGLAAATCLLLGICGSLAGAAPQPLGEPAPLLRGFGFDDAPGWAVGTWQGFNSRYNVQMTLEVYRDGRVRVSSDKGTQIGSFLSAHRVTLGGQPFRVRQEGGGFRMTQVSDASNTIVYRRTGGPGRPDRPGRPDGGGSRLPGWARGTFRGRNAQNNSRVQMTIHDNGSIDYRETRRGTNKPYTTTGSFSNGQIHLDSYTYAVQREGNGLRITQVDNADNSMLLTR